MEVGEAQVLKELKYKNVKPIYMIDEYGNIYSKYKKNFLKAQKDKDGIYKKEGKMYKLNLENIGDLKLITQTQYADALGLSFDYINKVFNNKLDVKLSTAKCIISLAYNIPVRDSELMQKLLAKHFIKIK